MSELSHDTIRQEIRAQYQKIIKLKEFGLITQSCSCTQDKHIEIFGYSKIDFEHAPKEANLLLGCANPARYALYKDAEHVLDLGCGAGFDCFLASHKVGKKGKVIGVDMMPEMISKARQIANTHKYRNVEFRLGEIEHLPIENESIDVIISNCVLNLSPDKHQVLKECRRVMKKNARLIICDILLDDNFIESKKNELQNLKSATCIKNALNVSQIKEILEKESFHNISISLNKIGKNSIDNWIQISDLSCSDMIFSTIIQANK